MSKLTEITQMFDDDTFLTIDGLDDAIIGVDNRSMVLVYSISKCLEILGEQMSADDAEEYFNFNILNAYIGEKTPLFIHDSF